MKEIIRILTVATVSLCLFASCNSAEQKNGGWSAFPYPSVPGVLTAPQEIQEYIFAHFWDSYFKDPEKVDSLELEQAVSNYVSLLLPRPLDKACSGITSLLEKAEGYQKENAGSDVFGRVGALVTKFLYDPNSPLRDEDIYRPFVQKLAESPFTEDAMRDALREDARKCSLNRRGTAAFDLTFTDASGKNHNLYGVDAANTVLVFSNPGCGACKEIVGSIQEIPGIEERIEMHDLAVVNVYIDEDLDLWEEYRKEYPSYWITGYDGKLILKKDTIYNIRAIPSVYLLDSGKNVILKDAPIERVTDYLQKAR